MLDRPLPIRGLASSVSTFWQFAGSRNEGSGACRSRGRSGLLEAPNYIRFKGENSPLYVLTSPTVGAGARTAKGEAFATRVHVDF